MARGQELVCSDQALKETFTEADLVSLYRFSFEIERARNRLDLNVGAADITGDHVVPNHIHTNRSEPRLGPVNQPEHPAGVHGGLGGTFVSNAPTHYNTTTWPPQETMITYWDNLMSSRYALELKRIYGVPGSEHTGYPYATLNIGSPNTPIGPPIMFLSNESSTASSVRATRRDEFGEEKTIYSVPTGEITMGTICMQGESSAMGAKGGSHANAAELVSPRNYEVESTSVQGNEQAADDTPVKSEEGNDEKGKN
ncbi:unnamed protein product [Brassica oleracea]